MFTKKGSAYDQARTMLGLPAACLPAIPTKVMSLKRTQLQALKTAIANALARGESADDVTRIICTFAGPRDHVYSVQDADVEARAFFITSRRPLTRSRVYAKRMHVLMFKGGKCTQAVGHYHYVFTTEWNTQAKYIRTDFGETTANITPVIISTDRALAYIRSQLAEGEDIIDDSLPGYEDDSYYGRRSGDYEMVRKTNDRWHYGTWDRQLPTDVNAIMRVEKPDTCAKSVFEINMLCGLVQYRGKYRGEHYIHFRQRISDRLAARIVAGIKDSKAHAYFF